MNFDVQSILRQALVFSVPGLWALTIHEFAHAYMAVRSGDPTPEQHGRLTLNPLAHLDPIGTLCILFVGFGWARPVPVNPYNFRNLRRDNILVSVAGVATNLAMALVSALIYRLVFGRAFPNTQNLAGFSLVQVWLYFSVVINLVLAIFNLLPLPPLDGSHVVETLLPYQYAEQWQRFARLGPIILVVLVVSGGIGWLLRLVVFPIVDVLV